MSTGEPQHQARKRIIVACDGTWKDSDTEYQVPSNVTRICRCIKAEGHDPKTGAVIPQIVYYQSGIGTETTLYNKLVGGSTGQGTWLLFALMPQSLINPTGLAEHIREACRFYAIYDLYHFSDVLCVKTPSSAIITIIMMR